LETQAQAGHVVGNKESLVLTACRHTSSIVVQAPRSGPFTVIHAASATAAASPPMARRRNRASACTIATPINTANQSPVVTWTTALVATSATEIHGRRRMNAAMAITPMPKASMRGWKYGSKEFALVRGTR